MMWKEAFRPYCPKRLIAAFVLFEGPSSGLGHLLETLKVT